MRYVWTAIPLCLIYLALTANFSLNNIIVGFLVCLIIAYLSDAPVTRLSLRRLPGALAALFVYIIVIFYDLILSSLWVARIVLDPKLPIKPGIIAVPSGSTSEYAEALSAHAITLTPGELVVEMDEHGVMYTHSLDATHPEDDARAAQQQRKNLLERIFD